MRILSAIFSLAIAAVPATSFAQTLVEPQTLPANFGEAPAHARASRVSDPSLPRNAVRQLLAQSAKVKAASVLPQNRQLAQNK
jgi:hypothetical protein